MRGGRSAHMEYFAGARREHPQIAFRCVGATFLKEFVKSELSPSGELHTGSAVRNRLFLILVGDL